MTVSTIAATAGYSEPVLSNSVQLSYSTVLYSMCRVLDCRPGAF